MYKGGPTTVYNEWHQILDSQAQSDVRYLELEERRMRFEHEDKEREERMKDEIDFDLRMMSTITQTANPHVSPYSFSQPVMIHIKMG